MMKGLNRNSERYVKNKGMFCPHCIYYGIIFIILKLIDDMSRILRVCSILEFVHKYQGKECPVCHRYKIRDDKFNFVVRRIGKNLLKKVLDRDRMKEVKLLNKYGYLLDEIGI